MHVSVYFEPCVLEVGTGTKKSVLVAFGRFGSDEFNCRKAAFVEINAVSLLSSIKSRFKDSRILAMLAKAQNRVH